MNLITHSVLVGACAIAFSVSAHGEPSTKDADNTARNERDRNQATVTPGDQGNSREDIDTTKRIRQGIIANKSLSTDAHNVKVITANGHVTLRGPVLDEQEKRTIEEIATGVASAANVDCQLEVKKTQN
jgi:osmotically-inducible protein OsmY